MIDLALMLPPHPGEKWKIAKQLGVDRAIAKLATPLTGREPPSNFDSLRFFKSGFDEAGIELIGLEGDQFDMGRIKLGTPGRDEDIERYRRMLENMGRLGIRLLCYNFMAVFGWLRTTTSALGRGGALCTAFEQARLATEPQAESSEVSEENLWSNLEYFLKAVIPVAEANGVLLALHPDDPPISPIRGVGRIISSFAAYQRVFDLVPSPSNGATFCQATFSLMEDVTEVGAAASSLIRRGKVFFIHSRNLAGDRWNFHETFPDEGKTDYAQLFIIYNEAGYSGPLRSDHAPAMEGELDFDPSKGGMSSGYEIKGMIFDVGYLKGLMRGLGIPYR
jgi:mannonate dehydratase